MQKQKQLLTRRHALAAMSAGALALCSSPSFAKATLGDDGIYHMDWYLESFLDLNEDLAGATAKGKRFAVMWGLKGCPACKRMHEVHMMDPKIEAYILDNFEILHLNHIGSREVTDFDGRKRSEKSFGEAYGIRFTPTIQFFPETLDGLKEMTPQQREVIRIPGYLRPDDFLDVFRFVEQRATGAKTFRDFLKSERG